MLKVGLTGNYCSGVDEIAEIYKNLQIPIFEVDLIIKFMFYNNSESIKKIQKEFGKIVFTNNILDMVAFNEPTKFRRLLKIIELDLIVAYERWRQVNQKAKFTIFKSSILFESNWNNIMNSNISVFKPNGLRVEAIQRKNKMKSSDAYSLIDTEMDVFQKNRLSDYTINNYPAYCDSVEKQIIAINKSIMTKTYSSIIST